MPTSEGEGSGLGVLGTPTTSPAQGLSLHGMQSATVPKILTPSHPISSSPALLGPPQTSTQYLHSPGSCGYPRESLSSLGSFLPAKEIPRGHSPSVPCAPQHVVRETITGLEERNLSLWQRPPKTGSFPVLSTSCSPHRQTQRPEGNNSRICCCCTNQGPECTSPSWPRRGVLQSQVGKAIRTISVATERVGLRPGAGQLGPHRLSH